FLIPLFGDLPDRFVRRLNKLPLLDFVQFFLLIGHRFLVGVEGFLYPVPMLPLVLVAMTFLATKVYGPGSRCRFADRHIYFLLFCFLLLTESKYLTASSVVRMIGCRPISIRVTLFVCIPNASANTLCVMPSRSLARFSSSLVMV